MGVPTSATLISIKMKSALLLLALAAVSTASPEDIYKKFLRSMDVYNFRMKCWGGEERGEAVCRHRDGQEEVHADGRGGGRSQVQEAGRGAGGVPGDERGVHLAVR